MLASSGGAAILMVTHLKVGPCSYKVQKPHQPEIHHILTAGRPPKKTAKAMEAATNTSVLNPMQSLHSREG